MSNRQMEERSEQRHDETLAAELGITVEELEQLSYREELVASDEGCPYFYLIEFGDDCPKEILDKIDGLEDRRSIQLGINVFDEEEPEE